MKLVEIFYSIQGEGANFGIPSIFVRLAGCNKDCWYCDTNWSEGYDMTPEEVLEEVKKYPAKRIIWTGGEPTLQLDDDILALFDGYYSCIETNGTNRVPSRIDYIACSPKVSAETLNRNFEFVNEFRFPIGLGDELPDITTLPKADSYFISPLFLGEEKKRFDLDEACVNYCVELVKSNPQWRLSIQVHKILNVR